MTALQKAEALLPQMSLVEKAQLFSKSSGLFQYGVPGHRENAWCMWRRCLHYPYPDSGKYPGIL